MAVIPDGNSLIDVGSVSSRPTRPQRSRMAKSTRATHARLAIVEGDVVAHVAVGLVHLVEQQVLRGLFAGLGQPVFALVVVVKRAAKILEVVGDRLRRPAPSAAIRGTSRASRAGGDLRVLHSAFDGRCRPMTSTVTMPPSALGSSRCRWRICDDALKILNERRFGAHLSRRRTRTGDEHARHAAMIARECRIVKRCTPLRKRSKSRSSASLSALRGGGQVADHDRHERHRQQKRRRHAESREISELANRLHAADRTATACRSQWSGR